MPLTEHSRVHLCIPAVRLLLVALLPACGGSTPTTGHEHAEENAARLQVFEGAGFQSVQLPGRADGYRNAHLFATQDGMPRFALPGGIVMPESERIFPIQPRLGPIDGAMGFVDGRFLVASQGQLLEVSRGNVVAQRTLDEHGRRVRIQRATPNAAYMWLGKHIALLGPDGSVRPLFELPHPITAVGGNGNLTLVATTDGTLYALRLNHPVRSILRHREPFQTVALDPSGYVLVADRAAVYLVAEGTAYPIAIGLRDPQLCAGRTHTHVFEPTRARLSRFRDLIAVEQRLGL